MLVHRSYSSLLFGSAVQPDSGRIFGDTSIIGRTRLDGMVIDLMELGGQRCQLHTGITKRMQAENCVRKMKTTKGSGFFFFLFTI